MSMSHFQRQQRQATRQARVFNAHQLITKQTGNVSTKDSAMFAQIAALGAAAEAKGVMHALVAKGIITSDEQQDFLDMGVKSLLDQITGGSGVRVDEVGLNG